MRVSLPMLAALAATLTLGACATDDPGLPSDPRARDTGTFPTFAATPAAAARQLPQGEVNRTVRRLEGAEAEALASPRPMMVAERAASLAGAGERADRDARADTSAPMMVEDRIASLDAAGRRAASSSAPADDTARLRRIGRTHEAETIRRIEGR